MKNIRGDNKYFSDYFQISRETLKSYGAININLVADIPLFIDPFLLFKSENDKYQGLHTEIIRYLTYLKDCASEEREGKELDSFLKSYFVFPEVKECWLGYSENGNEGAGLNIKFARQLYDGMNKIITNVGEEKICKTFHLEKVCLISDNVSVDKISDFTANLIKSFLLDYTERFAKQYIDKSFCQYVKVDNAYFDYQLQSFIPKQYFLPIYKNGEQTEYVLLTPCDIVRKDVNYINKTDLYENFDNVLQIAPETLKTRLQNYLTKELYNDEKQKVTKQDKAKCINELIRLNPIILDYYLKYKEDNCDKVLFEAQCERAEIIDVLVESVLQLQGFLSECSFYKKYNFDSLDESVDAVKYLKHAIEQNGVYTCFYDANGNAIYHEENLNHMFRLCFRNSHFKYNEQTNNGPGPCDSQVSYGSHDTAIVEFKLATNNNLKNNLLLQTEAYAEADNTNKKVKVIMFYTQKEKTRVMKILKEIDFIKYLDKTIFLIDCDKSNKISASKRKAV